jgi:hypothetical protein
MNKRPRIVQNLSWDRLCQGAGFASLLLGLISTVSADVILPVVRIEYEADGVSLSWKWINRNFTGRPRFSWQGGYGWFSVSPAGVDAAEAYVRSQKQHHQEVTFQDEFRRFLKKYQVDYDEHYVWD